jgi:hypothetical protein
MSGRQILYYGMMFQIIALVIGLLLEGWASFLPELFTSTRVLNRIIAIIVLLSGLYLLKKGELTISSNHMLAYLILLTVLGIVGIIALPLYSISYMSLSYIFAMTTFLLISVVGGISIAMLIIAKSK